MLSGLLGLPAAPAPEEASWFVGGRYGPRRGCGVELRSGPEAEAGVFHTASRPVLLLQIGSGEHAWAGDRGAPAQLPLVGLVAPGASSPPGWITLEDERGQRPLVRRRLGSSWEVRARYVVQSPSTVRAGPDLSSARLGELGPGEEVLSLQLCTCEPSDTARLRMMVSTEANLIGWLSPETAHGDKLLYPLNLLGPEVARRQHLGPRRCSYQLGLYVPWDVGGQYRTLERVSLAAAPQLSSREVCSLAPGTLVTVDDIHQVECPHIHWCPVASVVVDEGAARGSRGWLRCSGSDGRDLLDTRNQWECDEILARLLRQGTAAILEGQPMVDPAAEAISSWVVAGAPGFCVGWPVFDDDGNFRRGFAPSAEGSSETASVPDESRGSSPRVQRVGDDAGAAAAASDAGRLPPGAAGDASLRRLAEGMIVSL